MFLSYSLQSFQADALENIFSFVTWYGLISFKWFLQLSIFVGLIYLFLITIFLFNLSILSSTYWLCTELSLLTISIEIPLISSLKTEISLFLAPVNMSLVPVAASLSSQFNATKNPGTQTSKFRNMKYEATTIIWSQVHL